MEKEEQEILKLKKLIKETNTIIIGAGAGLSTSAGMLYSGKEFETNFADFIKKYGFKDLYSASFLISKIHKNFGPFGVD